MYRYTSTAEERMEQYIVELEQEIYLLKERNMDLENTISYLNEKKNNWESF